jgi:hypothetical protein
VIAPASDHTRHVLEVCGLNRGYGLATSNHHMSYRNDHDAAVARVDALTHELDRAEAERDRLQGERERLQTEVEHLRASPLAHGRRRRRDGLALTLLAFFIGITVDVFGHDHHVRRSAPPPPAPPAAPAIPELRVPKSTPTPSLEVPTTRIAPTPPTATKPISTKPVAAPPVRQRSAVPHDADTILACAARAQSAADSIATLTDLRPLRASCRAAIESMVRYRATSDEARQLLTRWLALEDRLSPSLAAYNTYVLRDPAGKRYRAPAALREEFYATLRARSAVLAALPGTLTR